MRRQTYQYKQKPDLNVFEVNGDSEEKDIFI